MNLLKIKYLALATMLFFSQMCLSQDVNPQQEVEKWQSDMNAQFKNAAESPLPANKISSFKALDFYPIDQKYRVVAKVKILEQEIAFGMKTTTSRLPMYKKFAEIYFSIENKEYKLFLYQNLDLVKKPEYHNYLFLPFTDKSSGIESYAGGRYIDIYYSGGDQIVVDFNKAYNPYCAYNPRYSCPVPPDENHLDVEIYAGVKKYH